MFRRALCLPLLALAAAGCGGSTAATAPTAPTAPARAGAPAPDTAALTVAGTDLRLGGAVADDGRGARRLAGPSRPDPDALRRAGRPRDGVGAGAGCPDQDLQPTDANTDRIVASTLCLLNGERADAGLAPLATDDELARAALAHSKDMVATSYFSHTAADGSSSTDRIRATGYIPTDRAWTVGENLAWGTGDLATPRNIVAAWMNSPGHRENVLRAVFDEIGFGVVAGNPSRADGQGATYTTTFGSLGADRAGADAPAGAPAPARTGTGARRARTRAEAARRRRARARGAHVARARTARHRAARARHSRASR